MKSETSFSSAAYSRCEPRRSTRTLGDITGRGPIKGKAQTLSTFRFYFGASLCGAQGHSWRGLRDHMWCCGSNSVDHMQDNCLTYCIISPAPKLLILSNNVLVFAEEVWVPFLAPPAPLSITGNKLSTEPGALGTELQVVPEHCQVCVQSTPHKKSIKCITYNMLFIVRYIWMAMVIRGSNHVLYH